jgi:hypothetical protein
MSEVVSTASNPIVIDLGKRKRKDVKKLNKGEGSLMDKIGDCVNELKSSKEISPNAQIVIVVVKEKPQKSWFL